VHDPVHRVKNFPCVVGGDSLMNLSMKQVESGSAFGGKIFRLSNRLYPCYKFLPIFAMGLGK